MSAASQQSRVRRMFFRGASSVRGKISSVSEGPNLVARVASLERDMQEQRALSMRVAQLTDIVQELLIPIADRDEEKLRRLLEEYATTL